MFEVPFASATLDFFSHSSTPNVVALSGTFPSNIRAPSVSSGYRKTADSEFPLYHFHQKS
jgi:hypothetical protein